MPLPVIADTYRVGLKWTGPSGGAANVLHIQIAGSNALAVANALDANANTTMWTGISNAYAVTELHVTPLDGSSATTIKSVTGTKWAGQASGDYIPAAAPIVSLRTSLRGPAHRGRLYLPPIAEGSQSNGVRTPLDVTNVQGAFNTWFGALTTAGMLLVVCSYKHASNAIVTTLVVEAALGTQRRRQQRFR